MNGVKCSFGFFAAAALMLYYGQDATVFFAAAAVHELGHIAAMLITEKGGTEVSFSAIGITLLPRDGKMTSRRTEALILVSGPLAGAVSALAARGYSNSFFEVSMMLSLVNMLPLRGTDGGSLFEMICDGKRGRLDAAAAAAVLAAFLGAAAFCGRKGLNTAWAAAVSALLLARHLLSEE